MNQFRKIQQICQEISPPEVEQDQEEYTINESLAYQQGKYDLAQEILTLVFAGLKR